MLVSAWNITQPGVVWGPTHSLWEEWLVSEEVGQGWPLLVKVTNDFPLIAFFLKSHPQAAYSSTRLVMQIGKRPKLLI